MMVIQDEVDVGYLPGEIMNLGTDLPGAVSKLWVGATARHHGRHWVRSNALEGEVEPEGRRGDRYTLVTSYTGGL